MITNYNITNFSCLAPVVH